MDTSINLRINAGQAKSEARDVKQSIESLYESFEKLKAEGNWKGAADALHKINSLQQEARASAASLGSNAQSGSSFNARQEAPSAGGGRSADAYRDFERNRDAGNWRDAARSAQRFQEEREQKNPANEKKSPFSRLFSSKDQQQEQAIRELEAQIEALTRASEELTEQLEAAIKAQETDAARSISETRNNVEKDRQALLQEKARLEGNDGKQEQSGLEKGLSMSMATQVLDLISSGVSVQSNYRQTRAAGDYIGAEIQKKQGIGNIASGIGNAALAGGAMTGFAPLLAIGGASKLVGYMLNWVSEKEKAEMAEAAAFERSLAPTHGLNKLYSNGGYGANNANAANLIGTGEASARGTGLATYEFLELAQQQASYGAKSIGEALNQTRTAALFSQATGANIGNAQNLIGIASRFGDNSNVLAYANGARAATGLGKGQTDEFLTSLSRVIEEGISAGYIRSTKEVSQNMTMLYKLSDNNQLWQGEYGAQRLSQMNQGIASAVSLQSTSDVITYAAAKGVLDRTGMKSIGGNALSGTYFDAMMMMENGVTPELFKEIAEQINKAEGGNRAAQIARYQEIFGLNASGSWQLYQMGQNAINGNMPSESALNNVLDAGTYESYETKKQNLINSLDKGVATASKDKFDTMLAKLEKLANEPPASLLDTLKSGAESVVDAIKELGSSIANALDAKLSPLLNKAFGAAEEEERLNEVSRDYGFKPGARNEATIRRSIDLYNANNDYGSFANAALQSLELPEVKNARSGGRDFFDLLFEHRTGTRRLSKEQSDLANEVFAKIIEGAAAAGGKKTVFGGVKRDVTVEEMVAIRKQLSPTNLHDLVASGNREEAIAVISAAIKRAFPNIEVETR